MEQKNVKIKIRGIVQGVGFRPFIHREARRFSINGFIRNTIEGVEIEAEGSVPDLQGFLSALQSEHPVLAMIDSIDTEENTELKHYESFQITESRGGEEKDTLISPDIGICEDCLRELRDPSDRRFQYPFINCTNCGPRFTIIKDVPYDRNKTTMARFPMCRLCEEEYTDITNRRYHAQPDCCPECGPEVFFKRSAISENEVSEIMHGMAAKEMTPGKTGDETVTGKAAVEAAIDFLEAGKIVAVKGIGGIHLACRADSPESVRLLRIKKQREEKPFAVMVRNLDAAKRFCHVGKEEESALTGFRRPIVLLEKKDRASFGYLSENNEIGIMLPYTPLHVLLFEQKKASYEALVMTSANLSDEPIICRNEEAEQRLAGIADGFLLHNRDIESRCDDSLIRIAEGKEYPIRRSRGYVPYPLKIEYSCGSVVKALEDKEILACGAEQKATFAMSKGLHLFQGPYIGDLKNMDVLSHYEQQIRHFEKMFSIHPEIIACDLHPDYLSTGYAQKRGETLVRVQHHHAHMASCMADNGIEGPCIGIIWDGTGLGTDETIWGAEFLVGDYAGFTREGSILPFFLPGGDKVTHELWRSAASLLFLCMDHNEGCPAETTDKSSVAEGDAALCRRGEELCGAARFARIRTMIENGWNCPAASSMGRLFDAAASLLNIKQEASYEGQGAMLLEAEGVRAGTGVQESFPYDIIKNDIYYFDYRKMIRELAVSKAPAGIQAVKFMNTLVDMAVKITCRIAEEQKLDRVVLSGGTFQNRYLLENLTKALRKAGLSVFHHHRVPTNDEGISVGQLMIAARKLCD